MEIERLDINDISQLEWTADSLKRFSETAVFMLPHYLKAVRDTYSFKTHYLVCREKEELIGIASFYEKPSLVGASTLEGVLGGFWAQNKKSEKLLLRGMAELAER